MPAIIGTIKVEPKEIKSRLGSLVNNFTGETKQALIEALKLLSISQKEEQLKEYLINIFYAEKMYEMNPSWVERKALEKSIHEAAEEVMPEMRWINNGH